MKPNEVHLAKLKKEYERCIRKIQRAEQNAERLEQAIENCESDHSRCLTGGPR
jgi:uncharacterized protein YdcH (DUF465 family)